MGSEIALTNNGIKHVIKLIRSLENIGILLKATTRKINSQEGVLLNFLYPLLRARLPLMKNLLTSLAKTFLIRLRLTVAVSTTDSSIQRRVFGSEMTTLLISNKEIDDIMKIVKSLEESGLLIKSVSKTKMKQKKKKVYFQAGY